MNQAQMQAALNAHDRVRRSTELPLFYGVKSKDSITAQNLINRVEKAATIATWDNARKLLEFYMILRDKALAAYEGLPDLGIADDDWDAVKDWFLSTYEIKYTPKTTCTNFAELIQRQGETVHDYFLRVQEAFKRMVQSQPDAIGTVREAAPVAGAAHDPNRDIRIKKEGLLDDQKFFKMHLFIAGMRDDLRTKVMQAGKDNIKDILDAARELELIEHDGKRKSLAPITEVTEPENDYDEEELAAVNAIRQKKGKPLLQRNQGGRFVSNNNGNNRSNSNGQVCRYCKKPNHMQKECRSRIRDRAPMVDANGKPYTKRINAVDNEDGAGNSTAAAAVPAATAIARDDQVYHLNW